MGAIRVASRRAAVARRSSLMWGGATAERVDGDRRPLVLDGVVGDILEIMPKLIENMVTKLYNIVHKRL